MQLLWANLWLEEGWRRSGQASLKLHTVETCQISEDFQKHVLHKLLCVIGKQTCNTVYLHANSQRWVRRNTS